MQKLRFVNGNGIEIDLTAGRYGVTEWSGFSNADLNIQSQQVPFQDGAVFLDALYNPRELSITLAINDENDLEKRYELKRELISIMNAKLGEGYLYYKNDFIEKRIKVIPQLPIFENKNSNDSGTLKASLTWTAPEVYWEDVEEKIIELKSDTFVDITNEGDISINPQIIINDNNLQFSEIKNIDTLKKIKINQGGNIVIETEVGKKKIYSEIMQNNTIGYTIKGCAWNNDTILFAGDKTLYSSQDGVNFQNNNNILLNNNIIVFYSNNFETFFVATGSLGSMYVYKTLDGKDISTIWSNTDIYFGLTEFVNFFENSNITFVIMKSSGSSLYLYEIKEDFTLKFIQLPIGSYYGTFLNKIIKNDEKFILYFYYQNVSYFYETEDFQNFNLLLQFNYQCSSIFILNDKLYISAVDNSLQEYDLNFELLESWNMSDIAQDGLFIHGESKKLIYSTKNIYIYNPDINDWDLVYAGNSNINIRQLLIFKGYLYCVLVLTSGQRILMKSEINNINFTQIISTNKFIYNTIIYDDLILYFDSYYCYDNIFLDKNSSASFFSKMVRFKNKIYGVKNNKLYISNDGWNFRILNNLIISNIESNNEKLILTYSNNPINLYVSTNGVDFSLYTINSTIEIKTIKFISELDKWFAVGYGGVLISDNGIDWEEVYSSADNFYDVVYDFTRNICKIPYYNAILRQGFMIYSSDLINWTSTARNSSQNCSSIAISDDGVIVYAEINGISYHLPSSELAVQKTLNNRISVPSSQFSTYLSKVFYSKILKKFILKLSDSDNILYTSTNGVDWIVNELCGISSVIYEDILLKLIYFPDIIVNFINNENLISKLSEDSDMNFSLLLGNNTIISNFNGTLTYRQKYLGV